MFKLDDLSYVLLDPSKSMAERFRALLTLKNIKSDEAVKIIEKAFQVNEDYSSLLRHELCYVLGQMKNETALNVLENILRDDKEDAMVRHEAAEAMGAIGLAKSLPVLSEFVYHPDKSIRETCEIAIDRIRYTQDDMKSGGYDSIDPAPASEEVDIQALQKTLMDTNLSLFDRYRAMFSLRNIGTPEAVNALAQGFQDESALFRHEVAYVFGQLQHPSSVPCLIQVLTNDQEHGMVRHEAAEALGAIATPECMKVLASFAQDKEKVVQQSCEVGLDILKYENSGEFQYAQVAEIEP